MRMMREMCQCRTWAAVVGGLAALALAAPDAQAQQRPARPAVAAAPPAAPPAATPADADPNWRSSDASAASPVPVTTGQQAPRVAESDIVERSAEVLDELSDISLQSIPRKLLASAHGLVIIPEVFKAGFLVGGRFGRGVLVIRQADGQWSNPIFLRLLGGSFGWQAGAQSTDVVLVIRSQKGLDRLLQGRKFTLGADAAVAAGPVGRNATAGTDLSLRAEVYSYSRSRGLFAGLALDGSALTIDREGNAAYYGREGASAGDILVGRDRQGQLLLARQSSQRLRKSLDEHAGTDVAEQVNTAPGPALD